MNRMYFIQTKSDLDKSIETDPLFKININLNPYIGCQYDCVYCPVQFHKKNGVKTNFMYKLEKGLNQDQKDLKFGIGSSCEPYSVLEKELNLVRNSIELISKYELPIQIFTKSDLILKDVDLLRSYSKKGLLAVSVSLFIMDNKISNIFEPNIILPKDRIRLLKELRKNEIFAGVVLAPIIPYISDSKEQIETVFREVKNADGEYILPVVLNVNNNILKDKLKTFFAKYFKDKGNLFFSLYSDKNMPPSLYTKKMSDILKELSKKYDIPVYLPLEDGCRNSVDIRHEMPFI